MEKLSEVLLPHIEQGRYHSCEWKIIHKIIHSTSGHHERR